MLYGFFSEMPVIFASEICWYSADRATWEIAIVGNEYLRFAREKLIDLELSTHD